MFSYGVQIAVVYANEKSLITFWNEYDGCFYSLGLHLFVDFFCKHFIDHSLPKLLRLSACQVWLFAYGFCVWLKQLDAVHCNVDATKVFIPHGLKMQLLVDDWFLVSMRLRGYIDIFAPILLHLSGGILFSTYMLVNLLLSISAIFIVTGSN